MFPCTSEGYYSADHDSHYVETWHEMEKLVDEGLVKSIGLSNFNIRQVREVLDCTKKHLPDVLQNESHPYLHEKDLRDFCHINGIVFQVNSLQASNFEPQSRIEDLEFLLAMPTCMLVMSSFGLYVY